MSHFNLTIGYQNIEGSHSPIFGCKHEEQLNLYNDIEILSETWAQLFKISKKNLREKLSLR